MTDDLHTMADTKEEAKDIKEKLGVDYDIPSIAVVEGVTRDATLEDAIRVYPGEDEVEYDLPNQMVWDLKGTFRWKAIALHNNDGEAVEWYAHSGDVMEYWPDFYDEPVWKQHSIYAFIKSWDEENNLTYALHDWPVDMDPDAEVIG